MRGQYLIDFFISIHVQLGLSVIVLDDLRNLVLHQTDPIVIRILKLQMIMRPISHNLGPFGALVAQDARLCDGVDYIMIII